VRARGGERERRRTEKTLHGLRRRDETTQRAAGPCLAPAPAGFTNQVEKLEGNRQIHWEVRNPPLPSPSTHPSLSRSLSLSLSRWRSLSLTHTHRHTNIRAHTHAPRITPSMTAPTSQGTARPTRTHVRRTRRSDLKSVRFDINKPLLSEPGTYKTVKARFWPWRPDKSPSPLSNCSHFDRRLRACAQAKPRCGAPQEAGASGYEPHGRPCGS